MEKSRKTVKNSSVNDAKHRILSTGGQLMRLKGFKNSSINDICAAAGVPKGSFFYHFGSKEDFARNYIVAYYNGICRRLEDRFSAAGGGYTDRLKGFFQERVQDLAAENFSGGCPLGNLAQELSDVNNDLRLSLDSALAAVTSVIAMFLEKAVATGELTPRTEPLEAANFILNSWEGALIRMKAAKSVTPLEQFVKYVFTVLLEVPHDD